MTSPQSKHKQPSNTGAFKYPARRRAGTKQPSRTDIIPFPIHVSQQPRDDVTKTKAMLDHLRKKQNRLEDLVALACDAEDNELYSFHPLLSRVEAAECYALLEGLAAPDAGRYGSNFYLDNDLVYRSNGDLVAGPYPTILFDLEPDALKSNAPEIKTRDRKVTEFIFE